MDDHRQPRRLLPNTPFPRLPRSASSDRHGSTTRIDDSRGGSLIRVARERVAITQTELARRMGVPKGSVSRWERGIVEPSHHAVMRALGACELDLVSQLVVRPQAVPATRHQADTRPAEHTVLGIDPEDPNEKPIRARRLWRMWERQYRRELQTSDDRRVRP